MFIESRIQIIFYSKKISHACPQLFLVSLLVFCIFLYWSS